MENHYLPLAIDDYFMPIEDYPENTSLRDLLNQYPDPRARLVIAMSLAAVIPNHCFIPFIRNIHNLELRMLFGGDFHPFQSRFVPTFKTALFVWAGMDSHLQADFLANFSLNHPIFKKGIVEAFQMQSLPSAGFTNSEWVNQAFRLSDHYLRYFMGSNLPLPEDHQDLPLTKLETALSYEDLVLPTYTMQELEDILKYAQNYQKMRQDQTLGAAFQAGYIALLYGEPGTGKTLIATTIGKKAGLATYQLNLAEVVSKYIGETAKNINKVFEELERAIDYLKGEPSILFIDEADALMGKRSEVKDSKDRYANMDVSNLLQKLEKFPGIVIMASNYQQNFDPAINRRIDTMVRVPQPEANERTQLWKNYLPAHLAYPTNNFARILGEKFRLAGAQISQIFKQVLINTCDEEVTVLDFERDLERVIKKEYIKAGEVYVRPRDLMTSAQIDEQQYEQQLWWEQAVPTGWSYMPLYLPRILAQAVSLSKQDIAHVVKTVKRKWEGGQYHMLPYEQGIETILREVCASRGQAWGEVKTLINDLLNAERLENNAPPTPAPQTPEKPKAKKPSPAPKSAKPSSQEKAPPKEDKPQEETPQEEAQVLSQREQLRAIAQAPAKRGKILGEKAAEKAWREQLPEGYYYATSAVPGHLARMYELCFDSLLWVLKFCLDKADEMGSQELTSKDHLTPALEALREHWGLESLLSAKILAEEEKKKKELEKLKKKVPHRNNAPKYWAMALPEGYSYARQDLGVSMAQFYPKWSFGQMLLLMEKAAEFADKDNTRSIAYTPHVKDALRELGIQLAL